MAVGGGTSSDTWLQIVSDVSGLTQIVPAQTIGASYGDAFLAGLAAGILERDALDSWVKAGREIRPRRELAERYDGLYRQYRNLYGQTRDIVHYLAKG